MLFCRKFGMRLTLIWLVTMSWNVLGYDFHDNRTQICIQQNRTDFLQANIDPDRPLFLLIGVFSCLRKKYPYYSHRGVFQRETFIQTAKRMAVEPSQNRNYQVGAVVYETGCFQNGITRVFLEILLAKLFDRPYFVLSVFTTQVTWKVYNARYALLAGNVPLFTYSHFPITNEEGLTFGQRPGIPFGRIDLELLGKSIVKLIDDLDIKELNIIAEECKLTEQLELKYFLDHKLSELKVCVTSRLEMPTTKLKRDKLISTIQFSHTANIFLVINSRSENGLDGLVELVSGLKPQNETLTWVSTGSRTEIPTNLTSNNELITFQRGVMSYLSTSSKEQVKSLFATKIKDISILRALTNDRYWNDNILNVSPNPGKLKQVEKTTTLFGHSLEDVLRIILTKMPKLFKSATLKQRRLNRIYERINTAQYSHVALKTRLVSKTIADEANEVTYNFRKIRKTALTNTKVFCFGPCNAGMERVLLNNQVRCCWKCRKCRLGAIRALNQTQCVQCPKDTMSNSARTQCLTYTRKPRQLTRTEIRISITGSVTCIAVCVFFLLIFYRRRTAPVVKASDVNLLFLQILVHLILFVLGLLPLIPASRLTCYSRLVIFGCMWTISAAITLVKSQKYLSIFNSKTRKTSKDIQQTNFLVFTTIFVCVLVQISFIVILTYFNENVYEIQKDDKTITEYYKCYLYPYRQGIFIYIEFLLMLCLIQSYRARHLPTNFNETKFITVAVSTTQVFIFSYLLSNKRQLMKEYVLLGIANLSMVLIMHGYKVFILLFYLEKNKRRPLRTVIRSNELLDFPKTKLCRR